MLVTEDRFTFLTGIFFYGGSVVDPTFFILSKSATFDPISQLPYSALVLKIEFNPPYNLVKSPKLEEETVFGHL